VAAEAATAGPGPVVAPPSGPPSGGVTAASAALRGADAAAGAGADPAAAPSSGYAGFDPFLIQVLKGLVADGIAVALAARDVRGVSPARAARADSNSSSYDSGSEPDARDTLTTEELHLVVQDCGYVQHQTDSTHHLAGFARHDLDNCPQFRGLANYPPYAKCTDRRRVEPGSIGKGLMHFESLAYDLRNVKLVLFSLLGQLHQEGEERSVFFELLAQCANSIDQLDHLVNLERSLNVYCAAMPSGSPLIPTRRGCPSTSPPSPKRTPTRTATSRRASSATRSTLTRWSTGPSAISSPRTPPTTTEAAAAAAGLGPSSSPRTSSAARAAGLASTALGVSGTARRRAATAATPTSASRGGALRPAMAATRATTRAAETAARAASSSATLATRAARLGAATAALKAEAAATTTKGSARRTIAARSRTPAALTQLAQATRRRAGGPGVDVTCHKIISATGGEPSLVGGVVLGARCWAPRRYLSLCRPALPLLRWSTSRARRSRRCNHTGFGSRCGGAQRNIAFTLPIKLLQQLGQLLLQAPRLTRALCLRR